MWYMHNGTGWWMVFNGLLMGAFWGGLIALIVWGIRRGTGCCSVPKQYGPVDVAKERYAKGEISREEFERLKKDLS